MPITLNGLSRALHYARLIRRQEEQEEREREEAKRAQQRETEAAWRNVRQQRIEAAHDRDGSIAAARKQREQAREEQQLAQMAAQLMRQQAKA